MKVIILAQAAVLALVLTVTSGARAATDGVGLFVEPGVTYERGSTRTDWPLISNDSTGESNGFGLMGRLGFHVIDIVFVAVDARYSMPNFKDSSVNYSADATQSLIGGLSSVFKRRFWDFAFGVATSSVEIWIRRRVDLST